MGHYQFVNVPPGSYEILAQSPGMSAARVAVMLSAGETSTADLRLALSAVKESVTVTASGREETLTSALQSVAVLDMTQLPMRSSASLGEVLQDEVGIAKRSSGSRQWTPRDSRLRWRS
ncbi:MAG: carboxypeptidase-like regulatory domain-containing protein [Acidobacteriota bacterium]